jgi:crotonobetainyl-CoA:carnitine CoA-transferase CaiB-like acyl-CoA transferase
VRVLRLGTPRERAGRRQLVVDLSSLWAGPLCAHLLAGAGARVVKVESVARPDGARSGPAAVFDLLHAGKSSVALDFASAAGRAALRRLVERADVVVEASRPRALRQLGIEAEALVAGRPGLTWVSITGHGREEPGAGWVAFGDDAAVAAGLAVASGGADDPVFCADAVADPLAGLAAALAALRALEAGGGCLIDVSLVGVAREALGAWPGPEARVLHLGDDWLVECEGTRERVALPRARKPAGCARPFGSDTAAVLREWTC